MKFGDLRDQMHPAVANTVPDTPEAQAILSGERYKPTTFGGLITHLVEVGIVEAGSFDEVRSGVTGILDISDETFTEMLRDTQPLRSKTVSTWSKAYRERSEKQLERTTFNAAHAQLKESLGQDVTTQQQQQFHTMVEELRAEVDGREKELGDLDENGYPRQGNLIRRKMELDRVYRPRLERMERSSYAMNLADLADRLKQDGLLNALGPEFAKKVLENFIYSGPIGHFIDTLDLQNFVEYWSGEYDEVDDEDIERLKDCWLPESFLVEELAGAYTYTYYFRYDASAPGHEALRNLPNPIEDICFVSEEEKTAFFIAFPLANGQRPNWRRLRQR